jgi:AraC-like DNA-binding protein
MGIDYHLYGSKNIHYHHITGEVPLIDFHLHDGCEIFFLISGDVNYFIEKKAYSINYGDLFFTNTNEIHKPAFLSNKTYERICLIFDPELIRQLSSPDFELLNCFYNRPKGEQNKLSFAGSQLEDIVKLFKKIENADKNLSNGGHILKLAHLVELLVILNRAFMSISTVEELSKIPQRLISVLDYIDNNLEKDLSLISLEQRFFISRFHLSRLFKEAICANIHEYIVFKRIAKAKELLLNNCSVTEACSESGFNDYSNFIRVFKKIVGTPPGKYRNKINK